MDEEATERSFADDTTKNLHTPPGNRVDEDKVIAEAHRIGLLRVLDRYYAKIGSRHQTPMGATESILVSLAHEGYTIVPTSEVRRPRLGSR